MLQPLINTACLLKRKVEANRIRIDATSEITVKPHSSRPPVYEAFEAMGLFYVPLIAVGK